MGQLGEYLLKDSQDWQDSKDRAYRENPWFIPEFIEIASKQIAQQFLVPSLLSFWAQTYGVKDQPSHPKTVGLVMAGNIPW